MKKNNPRNNLRIFSTEFGLENIYIKYSKVIG